MSRTLLTVSFVFMVAICNGQGWSKEFHEIPLTSNNGEELNMELIQRDTTIGLVHKDTLYWILSFMGVLDSKSENPFYESSVDLNYYWYNYWIEKWYLNLASSKIKNDKMFIANYGIFWIGVDTPAEYRLTMIENDQIVSNTFAILNDTIFIVSLRGSNLQLQGYDNEGRFIFSKNIVQLNSSLNKDDLDVKIKTVSDKIVIEAKSSKEGLNTCGIYIFNLNSSGELQELNYNGLCNTLRLQDLTTDEKNNIFASIEIDGSTGIVKIGKDGKTKRISTFGNNFEKILETKIAVSHGQIALLTSSANSFSFRCLDTNGNLLHEEILDHQCEVKNHESFEHKTDLMAFANSFVFAYTLIKNIETSGTINAIPHIFFFAYGNCERPIEIEDDDIATSSSNLKDESPINIFPNPSPGIFTIHFDKAGADPYKISVYNIRGELVKGKEVSMKNAEIDLSEHPPGIYVVKINTHGEEYVHKIIKK